MKKKKYTIVGTFLVIVLIIGFVYIDTHQLTKLTSINSNAVLYSYGDRLNDKTDLKDFDSQIKTWNGKYDAITVNMWFKMKISEIDYYNNVFQTAPDNAGLRLELSSPHMLSLIYGANANVQNFRGVTISDNIQFGTWYEVRITINTDGKMEFWLNNELVFENVLDSLNYSISDFAIGTGFNKTRSFNGEIKDFKVHLELYKGQSFFGKNMEALLYLLIMGMIFILLFPERVIRLGVKHRGK